MKTILLILSLLLSWAASGQHQASIYGTITEGPAGSPVPNQPVYFSIALGYDTLNILHDSIFTEESGFYDYTFQLNTMFARVEVSTPDCNGTVLSNTVVITDSLTSVNVDFTICNFTVCQAFFTFDQTGDYSFQFMDQSTGQNLNYFWDFGDNAISLEQHPAHTYNLTGIYEVCLYISSPDSTCFDAYCLQVAVGGGGGCMAQFTCYPDTVQNMLTYQFTDLSSGNIDAWYWTFGDGTFSQDQNPVHTYSLEGVYEICLAISGPDCQSTWCQTVNIQFPGNCYNYFTFQAVGNTYNFQGFHFPGTPVSFSWDFGDGSTGVGSSVNHTYIEEGVYYVSLVSADSLNCSASSSQIVAVGDTILFSQVYGQVFEGYFPMQEGFVMLSSVENNPGFEPFTEITEVDSSGIFLFPYVPNGQFLLYAVPQDDNGYLPTYFGGAHHWAEAEIFSPLQSGMMHTIDLEPIAGAMVWGNGIISGHINESPGKSDMLQYIQVILYNDAFEALATASADINGEFTFSGLADGLYYIYPELPATASNLIPVELTSNHPESTIYLNFSGFSILGESEPTIDPAGITMYPNPASELCSVTIPIRNPGYFSILLTDLRGRVHFSLNLFASPGQVAVDIPVRDLAEGLYLLKISEASGNGIVMKLIRN